MVHGGPEALEVVKLPEVESMEKLGMNRSLR
jgi:hypothetical protein